MTPSDHSILVQWLEGPFKKACQEDKMRLLESIWMLNVGRDHGDTSASCMAIAITSFVHGLIHGTMPITVPKDSN